MSRRYSSKSRSSETYDTRLILFDENIKKRQEHKKSQFYVQMEKSAIYPPKHWLILGHVVGAD